MGGEICLESEVSKGSTFHVDIPFQLAADCEQESAEIDRGRARRILLVDDHPLNLKIAAKLLEAEGHTVTEVRSGQQALEEFKSQSFDAVFMDVKMPDMDGYQVTQAIRELEGDSGKRTVIVALTAHAMEGDREKCLAAGMDDYLAKPLTIDLLREKLRAIEERLNLSS